MSRQVTDRQRIEDALATSEEHYRKVFDSTPRGMVMMGNDGRLLRVNRVFREMLGYTEEEFLAVPIESVSHPEDLGTEVDDIARLLAGEMLSFPMERRYLHKDGHVLWGLLHVSLAGHLQSGDSSCLIADVQDITTRKQAEEDLKRSETRHRSIIDAASAFIARADPVEGRFTFVNEAYRRLLGRSIEDLAGRSFMDIVHEDDRADVLAVFQQTLEAPLSRIQFECRVVAPGDPVWVSWDGGAILDKRGMITEIQAVGHDVTERRVAEQALRTSLQELRRSEDKFRLLTQYQTTIREQERRRISFDLHDEVCQDLVGIAIMVESLRQRLEPSRPAETTDFERIVHHIYKLVEHLRLLAHGLQPMLLQEFGLEGALSALVNGMSSDATRVAAEFQRPIPRLKGEMELAVYRIAQEALANATRHAAARTIGLTLGVTDHVLHLEVQDDGRGFTLQDCPHSQTLGLTSMEARATALGGCLDIRSEPGKGTVIHLQCPFDATAPETILDERPSR